MDFLLSDSSVPKNVKSAIKEARDHLNTQEDYVVRYPPRSTTWTLLVMT